MIVVALCTSKTVIYCCHYLVLIDETLNIHTQYVVYNPKTQVFSIYVNDLLWHVINIS